MAEGKRKERPGCWPSPGGFLIKASDEKPQISPLFTLEVLYRFRFQGRRAEEKEHASLALHHQRLRCQLSIPV